MSLLIVRSVRGLITSVMTFHPMRDCFARHLSMLQNRRRFFILFFNLACIGDPLPIEKNEKKIASFLRYCLLPGSLTMYKGPVRYPQVEISQYAEARPHSDRHRLTLGSIPYRIGRKVRNRLTVMRGLSSKANIFSDLTKVMDPKQLKRDDDRSRNISSASYALALLL